ncbi:Molybdopterin molybdenumtransferase (modular protein) [Burkholderia vietnamiensis]|nr:Molybdopterin molybdenumtransferase (modular protein) [Burkholderia vietnamiensis]
MNAARAVAIWAALAGVVALLFVASLSIGSVPMSPWQALASLVSHGGDALFADIVRTLRLPRALAGFACGALLALAGAQTPPPAMYAAFSTQRLNKRPGRTEYLRAIATRAADGRWHVAPAGSQSSASLSGLAAANCFIVLGHDCAAVDAGAPVDILPLDGLI